MNQTKIRKDLEERLPTVMKLGTMFWKPSSKILLSAETEKEIRYSINSQGEIHAYTGIQNMDRNQLFTFKVIFRSRNPGRCNF